MAEQVRGSAKEGGALKASGTFSHAEGTTTIASGASGSHAEGELTTASGYASHAEGSSTTASATTSHAEGSSTLAEGSSSHAEGYSTIAHAARSHAEGNSTTAYGTDSHAEGLSSYAQAPASHAEGNATYTTGSYSHAEGNNSIASRYAQWAKAAGVFSAQGDCQINNFVARAITTDGAATILTFDMSAVALTGVVNVLTLPVNKGHRFRIEAVARRTDVLTTFGGWTITGTIVRESSGNARFITTPTVVSDLDAAAAAWTLAVSVDTTDATNNYLKITATGEAAKTIRWAAALYTTEVG